MKNPQIQIRKRLRIKEFNIKIELSKISKGVKTLEKMVMMVLQEERVGQEVSKRNKIKETEKWTVGKLVVARVEAIVVTQVAVVVALVDLLALPLVKLAQKLQNLPSQRKLYSQKKK
jgi:hypothetical protein